MNNNFISRSFENRNLNKNPPPRNHYNCRTSNENEPKLYETNRDKDAQSDPIQRPFIEDDLVPWNTQWPEYEPVEFTAEKILKSNKYDPADVRQIKLWNDVDGKIDRRSHHGKYELQLALKRRPLNPVGRTGLSGRGHLGRWGPNHAADPIVTRWKRNENGGVVTNNGKPVLQFVAIQRKDTQEWAIPGGMVDPGEKVRETLKREFMEEATGSDTMTSEQKEEIKSKLETLFSGGLEIYRGYVDDPRNTDNAWMETAAYNFHDDDSDLFDKVKLNAGDDAEKVKWMDIDHNLKLYASHKDFIQKTVSKHKAHW